VTISETMFSELALRGSAVGVSVLCPGWVNTRINEAARNRPEGAPAPEAVALPGADAFRDVLEDMVRTGLDPADVAELVLDAILHDRLYVLTHPESSEFVRQRTERIVRGENPPPPVLPG
jgi:NAD(P)-dependent dehydrogenase (short-subunit alcohol dehydrogenase family)